MCLYISLFSNHIDADANIFIEYLAGIIYKGLNNPVMWKQKKNGGMVVSTISSTYQHRTVEQIFKRYKFRVLLVPTPSHIPFGQENNSSILGKSTLTFAFSLRKLQKLIRLLQRMKITSAWSLSKGLLSLSLT